MLAAVVVVYLWVIVSQGGGDGWQRPAMVTAFLLISVAAGAIAMTTPSPRVLVACGALMAAWTAIWGLLGIMSIGLPLLVISVAAYMVTTQYANGIGGRPWRRWSSSALLLSAAVGCC